MKSNKNVGYSIALLRLSFAAFLLLIGIDKILHTNAISKWESFVGPVLHAIIPLSTVSIVSIEGIVEILIAILLMTKWVRATAMALALTTLLVLLDLIILQFYNLALRDILFLISTFVLILLLGYRRITTEVVSETHIAAL